MSPEEATAGLWHQLRAGGICRGRLRVLKQVCLKAYRHGRMPGTSVVTADLDARMPLAASTSGYQIMLVETNEHGAEYNTSAGPLTGASAGVR